MDEAELKTKLMQLGMSGLAYTDEWDKVAKQLKKCQKGGKK